jgi:hypothetical protein
MKEVQVVPAPNVVTVINPKTVTGNAQNVNLQGTGIWSVLSISTTSDLAKK